jgi:hypothetical protein
VPQAFNPLAQPKLNYAKPHMGGNFLAPHPTGLTADCSAFKGVDISDKGIQTLMVLIVLTCSFLQGRTIPCALDFCDSV